VKFGSGEKRRFGPSHRISIMISSFVSFVHGLLPLLVVVQLLLIQEGLVVNANTSITSGGGGGEEGLVASVQGQQQDQNEQQQLAAEQAQLVRPPSPRYVIIWNRVPRTGSNAVANAIVDNFGGIGARASYPEEAEALLPPIRDKELLLFVNLKKHYYDQLSNAKLNASIYKEMPQHELTHHMFANNKIPIHVLLFGHFGYSKAITSTIEQYAREEAETWEEAHANKSNQEFTAIWMNFVREVN
jgi:hypothetical protein